MNAVKQPLAFPFEVTSEQSQLTGQQIRNALQARLDALSDDDLAGVCGANSEQLPGLDVTGRGFTVVKFRDLYSEPCSLQKSSLATKDAIWLGCASADPKIMASQARAHGVETTETTGWVPYPIPDEVQLNTRMHLSQDIVRQLLPYLLRFAATGELGNNQE